MMKLIDVPNVVFFLVLVFVLVLLVVVVVVVVVLAAAYSLESYLPCLFFFSKNTK